MGEMKRTLILAAACLPCACSWAPRFVRKTPVLRLLYRPSILPYLDDPMFSLEVRRGWKGPEKIPGGVRYEAGGRASISVAFHASGTEGWKPPEEFRRRMKESGSVEDSHILQEVVLSSRPACRIGYTTYLYDREVLLGERVDIRYTDLVMVPDPEGIFTAKLESAKADYPVYRRDFENLLENLTLRQPPMKSGD